MSDIFTTIGVALFSGLMMYFFGYREAGKARKAKEAKKRLADTKAAQEVRDGVEILDDVGLARRASKWLRRDND